MPPCCQQCGGLTKNIIARSQSSSGCCRRIGSGEQVATLHMRSVANGAAAFPASACFARLSTLQYRASALSAPVSPPFGIPSKFLAPSANSFRLDHPGYSLKSLPPRYVPRRQARTDRCEGSAGFRRGPVRLLCDTFPPGWMYVHHRPHCKRPDRPEHQKPPVSSVDFRGRRPARPGAGSSVRDHATNAEYPPAGPSAVWTFASHSNTS